MDYKNLLIKYIGHIIDMEGDACVELARVNPHPSRELPVFTEEEAVELGKLEIEARESFKDLR